MKINLSFISFLLGLLFVSSALGFEFIPEPPFYHENGWLLSKIQTDSSTIEYTFSSEGDLIKEERLYDGTVSYLVYYSHATDGDFITSEHDTNNDGIIDAVTSYEYNSSGNLIRDTFVNSSDDIILMENTYSYDSSGHCIEQRVDNGGDGIFVSVISSTYNSNGKIIKWTNDHDYYDDYIDSNGMTDPGISTREFEYDSDEMLTEFTTMNYSQSTIFINVLTYDSDDNLAQIVNYANDGSPTYTYFTWVKDNSNNSGDNNDETSNDVDSNSNENNDSNNDNDKNEEGLGKGGGGCFISGL